MLRSSLLTRGLTSLGLCGVMFVATPSLARPGQVEESVPGPIDRIEAAQRFLAAHPDNDFYYAGNRIQRVYGPAFSSGNSPEQSAEQFRFANVDLWGIAPEDLVPVGPFEDGRHQLPIMFDQQTGTYKFTGVYYTQVRNGVPVFRGGLILTVRNEAGYPLVLASSTLRDIGTFTPNMNAGRSTKNAFRALSEHVGDHFDVNTTRLVIWAGFDDVNAAPTLAHEYIVEGGNPATGLPLRMLYLVDAVTGAILYEENQVHDVDVTGRVSGMATAAEGAYSCNLPAVEAGIPYAKVSISGGDTVFADVNGNFTIPNAGAGSVTVNSTLDNGFFVVANQTAATSSFSQPVFPPGPANFLYDPAPTTDLKAAEINTLIAVTLLRDLAILYNPGFPTVSTQSAFPINVNINQSCNAFYLNSTINFYIAGGSCTNTGNRGVAAHEYGHNLVNKAGSGQGAYGEGMGDVVTILLTDGPCLGEGFNAGCGICLRNAQNGCLYPCSAAPNCGTEIHVCGQLISGCVWSTRNNLILTNPATYLAILGNLAINAMFVHGSGTAITPQITIDYLTLDDNDANIANGTPHYNEINAGFSVHNMAGPALSLVGFNYPDGRPSTVKPDGTSTIEVDAVAVSGTPQPGTGVVFVDTGSGFVQFPMTESPANSYTATIPGSPCGTVVKYYFRVTAVGGTQQFSPTNAPTSFYTAVSAFDSVVPFNDNFQTSQGWTVTDVPIAGGTFAGTWERGVPVTPPAAGAPGTDADGSGQCYVTRNNNTNPDVDFGTTILTSPIMDATGSNVSINYSRWFRRNSTTANGDVFNVEMSVNGGTSWVNLEFLGSTTGAITGAWVAKSFPIVGGTNQFRIRFSINDNSTNSTSIEGGVDGVSLVRLICTPPEPLCPADVTGDGFVNVDDLLGVINSWGPCPGCPSDLTGDGFVNVDDLLGVINAWGACPP